MIWSKASVPTGWSNHSLFVTQKDVTFPQLLQFSSWCCLYVPPKFIFPVGNWITQTVNQTWKNIAILNLNLSKSSTPQNVAATPFFSWKMSWSFQLGIPNILTPPKISSQIFRIMDLLHPFWERPCWSQSRTISFPESRKPNKNGTKFVVLSVFVRIVTLSKGYGMIRPMFMLEEKMIPNNLANIPSMSVFQDGASHFFLEINIKIFTDIWGSTKIVVLMVSGKGVRKCVFFIVFLFRVTSLWSLLPQNPSMESNTTSHYEELAVANLVQRDPIKVGWTR